MSVYYYCEPASGYTNGREKASASARRSRGMRPGTMISSSRSNYTSRTFVLTMLIVISLFSGFLVTAYATAETSDSKPSSDVPAAAAILAAGESATEQRIIDVAPGDSLWSIAAQYSNGKKIRSYMKELAELNHLTSSELQIGQLLILPEEKK